MAGIQPIVESLFRWIWRINGLMLLALIALGIYIAYGASHVQDDARAQASVAMEGNVTPSRKSGKQDTDLRLGLMLSLSGTPMLYAPLKAPNDPTSLSFDGTIPARTHNVLFFNIATQREHWLFKDNHQVISRPEVLQRDDLARAHDRPPTRQAIGMIFGVHPDNDRSRLWNIDLASVDGLHLTTLARDVDGMMGFHFTPDAQSLLVFYTARGKAWVLDVDLESQKVVSIRPLATPH